MRHLAKSVGHHGTDLIAGAVGAFKIGKARLDRGVALFQGIIGGIADQRRIIAVIGGIGLTLGIGQTCQFNHGIGLRQIRNGDACGVLILSCHVHRLPPHVTRVILRAR